MRGCGRKATAPAGSAMLPGLSSASGDVAGLQSASKGSPMNLAGKVALIGGAGGGICRAIAVAFANAGAAPEMNAVATQAAAILRPLFAIASSSSPEEAGSR